MEGGEGANYLSFCLRKLVFCESGAEECQTITQDHSQCQESEAKQQPNEAKEKKLNKSQMFLNTRTGDWLLLKATHGAGSRGWSDYVKRGSRHQEERAGVKVVV